MDINKNLVFTAPTHFSKILKLKKWTKFSRKFFFGSIDKVHSYIFDFVWVENGVLQLNGVFTCVVYPVGIPDGLSEIFTINSPV